MTDRPIMSKPLTLQYFGDGDAPSGARHVVMLPPAEWDIFEGDDGVLLHILKDAQSGESLWLHARLALDVQKRSITSHKDGGEAIDLYLLPVIEPV